MFCLFFSCLVVTIYLRSLQCNDVCNALLFPQLFAFSHKINIEDYKYIWIECKYDEKKESSLNRLCSVRMGEETKNLFATLFVK